MKKNGELNQSVMELMDNIEQILLEIMDRDRPYIEQLMKTAKPMLERIQLIAAELELKVYNQNQSVSQYTGESD